MRVGDDYLYFAGHGEYLPTVEEERYCDPEDDAERAQDPAWLRNNPALISLGWEGDVPCGLYVRMTCSEEELQSRIDNFYENVKNGPAGGDDDTFDYWPSGVKLLRQMIADVPRDPKHVDMFHHIKKAVEERLEDLADEVLAKCGFSTGSTIDDLMSVDEEMLDNVHSMFEGCIGVVRETSTVRDCYFLASVTHEVLCASIEAPDKICDLAMEVPSIVVWPGKPAGDGKLHLTWREARQLCAALWRTTNIAEFG